MKMRFRQLVPWILVTVFGDAACAEGPQTPDAHDADATQTIRRAVEALNSEDTEIRAGAVMLLGKYKSFQALIAITNALDDPSTRVRRAAVVSALEWELNLPPITAFALLDRLDDRDVEIRRSVSSQLRLLLAASRMNGQTSRMGQEGTPIAAMSKITQAFKDPDPIVRENMLRVWSHLRTPLSTSDWLKLIRDPDPDVRLLAFPIAAKQLQTDLFLPVARQWLTSEERAERLLGAREIAETAPEQSLGLLEELVRSDDAEIAQTALGGLIRATDDPQWIDLAVSWLSRNEVPTELGTTLLNAFRFTRRPFGPWADPLRELPNPELRARAAYLLIRLVPDTERLALLLDYLGDETSEVRRPAISTLLNDAELLDASVLEALSSSRFEEVRAALANRLSRLPPDFSAEAAGDLLFDPDPGIRAKALDFIVTRRLSGWETAIEVATGEHENPIPATTLRLIRTLPPESQRPLLTQFAIQHADSAYGKSAAQLLKRLP